MLPCNFCRVCIHWGDHADEDSTTANSLTPFLSLLSQEMKNHIYELVLGGNLIHIKRDLIISRRDVVHSTKGDIKEQRFTHQICSSHISEEDAEDRFYAEQDSCLYVRDIELRHSRCGTATLDGTTPAPSRMDINLLHACRQIYNEARFMPYSFNTFSFDSPRNLRAFVHLLIRRGVNVNEAIRSLHIDLLHVNHDLHGWFQAFNAVTQHMTLLEKVFINVDQKPYWSISDDDDQKILAMKPVMICLAILRNTPIKSAAIVVSDRFLARSSATSLSRLSNFDIECRWCLWVKKLWADAIKEGILGRQRSGSENTDGAE